MKKIIIIFALILSIWCDISISHAEGKPWDNTVTNAWTSKSVIVTEMVPWASCQCWYSNAVGDSGEKAWQWMNEWNNACKETPIQERKYRCTVEPWFWSFQKMFAQIIRWFIFIVMLLGVLGIVWLGIAWAWAGGDDVKAKWNLKKWGINIAIGLVILFFFRYILTIIAPWIYN
jgi:hypothetical protein